MHFEVIVPSMKADDSCVTWASRPRLAHIRLSDDRWKTHGQDAGKMPVPLKQRNEYEMHRLSK
ncbi:MAG: hypothetical protein SFY80_02425 [Verrucomicrobiota bacterium]|nr:hypothetical protein [Verrucomicrobiota bacterium]